MGGSRGRALLKQLRHGVLCLVACSAVVQLQLALAAAASTAQPLAPGTYVFRFPGRQLCGAYQGEHLAGQLDGCGWRCACGGHPANQRSEPSSMPTAVGSLPFDAAAAAALAGYLSVKPCGSPDVVDAWPVKDHSGRQVG